MNALRHFEGALEREHAIPAPRWEVWEKKTVRTYRMAVVRIALPRELVKRFRATCDFTPADSIQKITAEDNWDGTFSPRKEGARWLWRSKDSGWRLCDAPAGWTDHERARFKVTVPEDVWHQLVSCAGEMGVSVHDWALACLDYHVRIEQTIT